MAKPKHDPVTRPAWERMVRIHQSLAAREYPNSQGLAREFEVSTRTIKRDLDFMRDRLELPIAYDSRRVGFHYTKPVDKFPSLPVTEAEIFALLVAHKAIAQYRGTPFEKPLQSAFRKLSGHLAHSGDYTVTDLQQVLSFRPFAPDDSDLETFEILNRALQQRRPLRFIYKKLGAKGSETRDLHPYHLTCVENHWYLIGFDPLRAAMRTFALNRLSDPEVLAGQFKVPKEFDPQDYLRGSFGVFKGADDFEVVVHFDDWGADLIRGRTWHPSQEMTEMPDGGVRLRMRLNNIEEIERWILSWGVHATVVRPATLVERLRKITDTLATRYTEPVPDPPLPARTNPGLPF